MAADPEQTSGHARRDAPAGDDHARLVRGGWRSATSDGSTQPVASTGPEEGRTGPVEGTTLLDTRPEAAAPVDHEDLPEVELDGASTEDGVVDLRADERATPIGTSAEAARPDEPAAPDDPTGDDAPMDLTLGDTPDETDAAAPAARRGRRVQRRGSRRWRRTRDASGVQAPPATDTAPSDEDHAVAAGTDGTTTSGQGVDPPPVADDAPPVEDHLPEEAPLDAATVAAVGAELRAVEHPRDQEPGTGPDVHDGDEHGGDEPDGDGAAPARSRRRSRRGRRLPTAGEGPRAIARREARRTRVRRIAFGVVAVGVAGVTAVVAGPPMLDALRDRTVGTSEPGTADQPVAVEDVPVAAAEAPVTVLLTTTEGVGDGAATGAVVLGFDPTTEQGTILLVPTTLATDVPGFGLLQLAGAEQVGGAELVGLTLTNLLGIGFDTTASLTEQDWAALFARVGGYEVEVREALTVTDGDGDREVRFQPGAQFLDGQRLAELLTLRQAGEPELGALPRAQTVLEGLLRQVDEDGLAALFEDGAPMVRATEPAAVEDVVRGLVAAAAADRLDVRTLPVTPIATGDDASYRLDEAGADALVADRFPGAVDTDTATAATGLRLEIRNGVGTPGLGADVTQLLVPLGHEVVLTGNTERFDVRTTRVVVYDDDPDIVRGAQGIVEALGVGRVELSEVPQGITDATILIGSDFQP